jgi:beta-glucosidase
MMNQSPERTPPPSDDVAAYAVAKARVRAGADPALEAGLLVARMTTQEKIGCLDGDTNFWDGLLDMVAGGYYRHPFPAARVPRLGFPGLSFSDGPRGIVIGASTCFPVSMARGATFDPELEEAIGNAIGIEARLQGADFYGGVCVNLLRHPGWGRAQETYGEDPFHVGEMGAALTRGVQRHAMACVKHFACNSIENARFVVNVEASRDVLDDVYFAHFRRIVQEGVAAVMTSYNSLNGEWCGQSRELIAGILREEWGFDGIVMSDFVYGLRDPAASVAAGLDIEMPFRQQRALALEFALAEGTITIEQVEACVRRVVATVLRFDAARDDKLPDRTLLAGPSHRALARRTAAESIVLLRNEPAAGDPSPVLPLAPGNLRRIAVLGRLADRPNLGDRGSSDVHPPSVVTPLAGLRAALPDVDFTDDAASADVAIVVAGYTFEDEGEFTAAVSAELFALMPPVPDEGVWGRFAEASASGHSMAAGGDRRSLRLRDEDEALIAATAAVQPRTVVVLVGGSAIMVETWIDSVAAVLHAWYPGMEGGHAIADVLLGIVNPSGRLPFAVPTDETHLACFDPDATQIRYDRWHGQWLLDRDAREVRFPFGFGLSYTSFRIESARADGGSITVDIVNDGARDGAVVVFVFRPEGQTMRLVAFRKVFVASMQRAGVVLPIATSGHRTAAAHFGSFVVALHARDPHALAIEVSP